MPALSGRFQSTVLFKGGRLVFGHIPFSMDLNFEFVDLAPGDRSFSSQTGP